MSSNVPATQLQMEILTELRNHVVDWRSVLQICRTLDSRGFGPGATERSGVTDIGSLFQYMVDRAKVKPDEFNYDFLIEILMRNDGFAELVKAIKSAIDEHKAKAKRPKRLSIDNAAAIDSKRLKRVYTEPDGIHEILPIEPYPFTGYQFVIIINNFTKGKWKRNGTMKDEELLKDFLKLQEDHGCVSEVKSYIDLRKTELIAALKDAKQNLLKMSRNYDRVLLFIFSHGVKDGVEGFYETSAERSDDNVVSIDEVTDMLEPTLKGKPKLIFINACNGDTENRQIPRVHADSSLESPEPPVFLTSPSESVDSDYNETFYQPHDPKQADILVSCASVKGFKSFRQDKGTWYMNCLMDVFSKFLTSNHLLELMTHTQLLVSEKVGELKKTSPDNFRNPSATISGKMLLAQMPTFRSTLRRPVYLIPRVQTNSPQ